MSGQMPDAAPSQQASPDFRHQHVGNSHATRLLQQQLRRLAGSETPVLLVGEAGTGKELAARAIHNSGRAMRPFLAMNCAGIPDDLVENELFGYEEAAFTGATAQKKGGIERAAGGTLFLEEIGDLSLELQRKLLCVLQQRELTRVGGTQAIPVGFRLISASIRPMVNEVLAGRFRAAPLLASDARGGTAAARAALRHPGTRPFLRCSIQIVVALAQCAPFRCGCQVPDGIQLAG